MRLSTRLSLFFVGSVTVVLASFSVALYLLASKYLYRQVDERLDAVLSTLVAAAEIGPAGVEWEPHERTLTFGRRILEGQLAWQVCDEKGRRLDGAGTGGPDQILARAASVRYPNGHPRTLRDREGVAWRASVRRLERPSSGGKRVQARSVAPGAHAALMVVAAVSTEGVTITLRSLVLTLLGLSLGIGAGALLCGNRISRRALRPVTTMAAALHRVEPGELQKRLPVPPSRDELQELGVSFNALFDRLQESYDRQARFAGDASHQLRTPLTAIQGQVDLALRQERGADEYRRVLELVQRRTRHLRRIVESLLFLARGDRERLALEFETIDLDEWLAEHARTWHDIGRRPDLRLEIDQGGPYRVRAQPALLAELVDNLLDNASRYSERGTPIRLKLGQSGSSVTVGVEDEGIGIADHDMPHVFAPFYRAADPRLRDSSGSGLGLAIARRIAESLGGTITVASSFGKRSAFTISLPSHRVTSGQTAHPEMPDPASASGNRLAVAEDRGRHRGA